MDRFEEAKLRIKEATDLVALIESYIPLKPRGRNLLALCPFHAENTPSFSVSREGQFFHCFGCGKSGDAFTWLQERDGVSFREAMEILGERAGVDLEGVFQQNSERRRGPDEYAVLAEVATFFHDQLRTERGAVARDYLIGRGLESAILPWTLGYHPPRGGLLRFAQAKELPKSVLEDAGLLRSGREMFAGRAMFPIHDERGRVVAFGGRVIPGSPEAQADGDYKPPKYYNSPESPLFNKRRLLFGLHHVKRAGHRRLFVMEGYTDVIACHAAGFEGAVASLGTAFTAEHARLVERYASEGLVLMFDGDRAGRTAAERAMRELVNTRLDVRIVVMSDAGDGIKDPADMVSARPGEEIELVTERRIRFEDIIEGADKALTVWFRLLRDRIDLNDAIGIEAAARECVELLQLVDNDVRRAALRQDMARHLAVPEQTLQRLMQKTPRRQPRAEERDPGPDNGAGPKPAPLSMRERAEAELLACLLARPDLLAEDVGGGLAFDSAAIAELINLAGEGFELGRAEPDAMISYLFTRIAEQPGLRAALGAAAARAQEIPDVEGVFAGLMQARRRHGQEPERRSLRLRLQQALAAGDRTTADALQAQLLESIRLERPRIHNSEPAPTSESRTGPLPAFLNQSPNPRSGVQPPDPDGTD